MLPSIILYNAISVDGRIDWFKLETHRFHRLISTFLVGGITPKTIFHAPDLTSAKGVINLRLSHFKKLKCNIFWLRYKVVKKGG